MEEKITIREALEMIANGLAQIQVPAGMTEQIARPISSAINGLRECVIAIDQAEKAAKPREE